MSPSPTAEKPRLRRHRCPVEPEPEAEPEVEPYRVGYGQPPLHTRFQKGRSGNPRGRPPGARNTATILAELMNQRRKVRLDGVDRTLRNVEIMFQQMMKKALAGDPKATQYLLALYRDSEAKAAPLEGASAPMDQLELDEADRALLAHHQRDRLQAKGLSEEQIEAALLAFGLGPAEGEP